LIYVVLGHFIFFESDLQCVMGSNIQNVKHVYSNQTHLC